MPICLVPSYGGPRVRNSALTNLGASLASLVGSRVVASAVVSTNGRRRRRRIRRD
ncbi:hypothetical protein ALC60_04160 [Trachymyrmex zeteki]|uniref:Uncharacterized protein n=1 Tax=Mycetomoellerius zeteki TaxID=64791 RepID=A0A151X991_9HYME|nr:hypothetical protein ALC60_04160 [Trachymyrmex zeteki]